MKMKPIESMQVEEPIDKEGASQEISEKKGKLKGIEEIEKLTDIEIAMFFIRHIDNPCEDSDGNNIRDFYLREAKKILDRFANPFAKQLLEDKIRQYEQP